jgi:hypothetical protein
MATVRLREASEYPAAAQKLFELSKAWFKMRRGGVGARGVMEILGVTQMFSSYTKIADTLQLEPDMHDIAPVDWSPAPGGAPRHPAAPRAEAP